VKYTIPPREENPICQECLVSQPHLHKECDCPCSHLVAWLGHEARRQVAEAARQTVWDLKSREEYEDCILPADTSQLG